MFFIYMTLLTPSLVESCYCPAPSGSQGHEVRSRSFIRNRGKLLLLNGIRATRPLVLRTLAEEQAGTRILLQSLS